MPLVGAPFRADYDCSADGAADVGIFLRGLNGELLDRVRRKVLQAATDVVVGIVASIYRQLHV